MNNLKRLASWLLIASGLTHLSMPVVYGPSEDTNPVAMFGALYVLIGALTLKDKRPALFAGVIFPTIGLIGASATFKTSRIALPISLFFMLVDVIVVPIFGRAIREGQ